jgi:hypothetical protein
MRTARLVGLSPDGKSLIVATDTGEQLAIVVDARLRAAMHGDRPRLGQLEIEMHTSLSPRDIQTRIRSGASLEDVARVAGIPLDRVERFAAPVLAEREHVAAMAMSSSVRRRGETSGHRKLRIAVTERLVSRGVDIDSIVWDSHRQEDGRWTVTADYRSGEAAHQAVFAYDAHARFSVAANDEARWLVGEQSPAKGPQPGRRRPSPTLTEPSADDETEPTLDLSDDLALVRATQERAEEEEVAGGAVVRALRPVANLPDEAPEEDRETPAYAGPSDASAVPTTIDAVWEPAPEVNYPVEPGVEDEDEEPTAALGPDEGSKAGEAPTDDTSARLEPVSAPKPPADEEGSAEETADQKTPVDEETVVVRRPPKRRHASVPSWDEIVFGGPRNPSARPKR